MNCDTLEQPLRVKKEEFGALVGSGIVEEKENEEIGQGNILIAVIPHSKAEATRIESEWLDRGSKEVIRQ